MCAHMAHRVQEGSLTDAVNFDSH